MCFPFLWDGNTVKKAESQKVSASRRENYLARADCTIASLRFNVLQFRFSPCSKLSLKHPISLPPI